MSHIHHIGVSNAAADYQAYLDRLRANRREDRAKVHGDAGLRTFDSAIDADRDADGEGQGETDAEPEAQQREPESESGTRYA